jgi:hypothetical protein
MRKFLLIVILIASLPCAAQPFAEVGFGNTIRPNAGFLFPKGLLRNTELSVSYDFPYGIDEKSHATTILAGRLLLQEGGQLRRIQVTVMAGAAYYTQTFRDVYTHTGEYLEQLDVYGWKPAAALQLGVDMGARGRLGIGGSYSDRFRAQIFMRAFFQAERSHK